jgi:hypothetical protein
MHIFPNHGSRRFSILFKRLYSQVLPVFLPLYCPVIYSLRSIIITSILEINHIWNSCHYSNWLLSSVCTLFATSSNHALIRITPLFSFAFIFLCLPLCTYFSRGYLTFVIVRSRWTVKIYRPNYFLFFQKENYVKQCESLDGMTFDRCAERREMCVWKKLGGKNINSNGVTVCWSSDNFSYFMRKDWFILSSFPCYPPNDVETRQILMKLSMGITPVEDTSYLWISLNSLQR